MYQAVQIKFHLLNNTKDNCIFYVETTAHLRDTRARKNSTPTQFFTKRTVLYSKRITTHKINQPTSWRHGLQLLNEHLCQFPDMSPTVIKKSWTHDLTFLIF